MSNRRSVKSKRLRFGSLKIIELPIVLGDNVTSDGGAPLACGWEPLSTLTIPVDLYEASREDDDGVRQRSKFRMTAIERAALLNRAGYTLDDILEASSISLETAKHRAESAQDSQWGGFLENTVTEVHQKIAKTISVCKASLFVPIWKHLEYITATQPSSL